MKNSAAEEEQEVPVPLAIHLNNILHSIFSNVEKYINNQQIYKSNGLYAHKFYISINFKWGISEYKGVLHCQGYDFEKIPDDIIEAPLSEPFLRTRMEMLSRPDGFMLYGKPLVDFFPTSELLYPNIKIWLQLFRARLNFYMIGGNPNVRLGIVDYSLYTRCSALQDDFHRKPTDMLAYTSLEFNYLETLAKTFIISSRQNQFIQEKSSTMFQFVGGLLLLWIQTPHSKDHTLKIHSVSTIWSQTIYNTQKWSTNRRLWCCWLSSPLCYDKESNELARWYPLNSRW